MIELVRSQYLIEAIYLVAFHSIAEVDEFARYGASRDPGR